MTYKENLFFYMFICYILCLVLMVIIAIFYNLIIKIENYLKHKKEIEEVTEIVKKVSENIFSDSEEEIIKGYERLLNEIEKENKEL